jgi:formylglycine-generating enzyme required for sulfatase activity
MNFNLQEWKDSVKAQLPGWQSRMKAAGFKSIYYLIAATSFIPIVQAAQSGNMSEVLALGALLSGAVGGNLLANMVQNLKDKSDVEVAQALQAEVEKTPEIKAELDALLEKLGALQQAGQVLPEEGKCWFEETIQRELAELNSSVTYTAMLTGDGAIAQGEGAKAVGKGGVLISGNATGNTIVTGNNNMINQIPEKGVSPKALRSAYLRCLFDRVSPVALTGVDRKSASEAEVRLNLSAIYTALMTLSTETEAKRVPPVDNKNERIEIRIQQISAIDLLNEYDRLALLGEPGSGKSTFVNFVVLCMAGEALGDKTANLKLLTAPIPLSEEERRHLRKKEPMTQPWDHGPLLPVRVILRDFAARGLPAPGQKASAEHLWKFIVAELKASALGEYVEPLKKELLQNGGLILFDGLDEVPEAEKRRDQIRQALDEFASVFGKCRFLVTSRTYAYQKQDWKLHNFEETVLAPFSRSQVERFVDDWYEHIAIVRKLDMSDARGKAELLKMAINNSDRLTALAERPLLLTLMASLHAWRGGTLPERREELYADTVDLLLDWWENQRVVRDQTGKPVNIQPSLAEWLKVDRQKVRDLLNKLAFEAHSNQENLKGTADVVEKDLLSGMMALSNNPDVKPGRLLEYLRDRAGLLVPRGVGVYTFPHRTFQEYLAACYLTDHGYPEEVAMYCRQDPNRWREVALLAGAKAARGGAFALWPLVDVLSLESDQCGEEACAWGAQIAGQSIQEIADLQNVGEANKPKVKRVLERLIDILDGERLPVLERVSVGKTLVALGDPRPEITTLEGMQFCYVPAGKFIMGSQEGEGEERERPQHEVDLPAYWMGRYPVTNAQYAAFVQSGGYQNPDFWPEARKAKVWINGKVKAWNDNAPRHNPVGFGNPFHLENHPVVGITWYEMLAFTRWLTETWQETHILPEDWQVGLPSEAEWEKAARGGLQVPHKPVLRSVVQKEQSWQVDKDSLKMGINPDPRRKYPWMQEFTLGYANCDSAGIGSTSALGCFSKNVSPYGVVELSGNVWEWTRSLLKDYPYLPNDGREGLESESQRVLRGGAFHYSEDLLRCACRGRYDPAYRLIFLGFRVMVSPSSK